MTLHELREVPTPPGEALAALLETVPTDLETAAAELARAATRLAGTRVTVAPCAADAPEFPAGAPDAAGGTRCDGTALYWDPAAELPLPARSLLRQACVWLALLRCERSARAQADSAAVEAEAIREVSRQLLSVRDLDHLLRSVAERVLRLLESDICGVLLREGDVVRMRACVGNRAARTARLQMHRGQGVAGLVFQTGEPARVDSYLDDETISSDFMSLAAKEETRSALAVPLRLHGELIGVLEVWRRRHSTFTDRDVRRMVTLADFATIAIDNARLYDEQSAAAVETAAARDALQHQLTVLDRASRLQQNLLSTVIHGGGLPAITRTVATELDCEVGVYGPDGVRLATHCGRDSASALPAAVPVGNRPLVGVPEKGIWTRPVSADGDQIGLVLLAQGRQSADIMDAVAGQVAMACSLALLRERAASRARAETIEQVVWDLVQGPVEHRLAARTRAQQLSVPLSGRLRVLHGRIENIESLATERGWDTSHTDRVRRQVLRTVRTLEGRGLTLASLRGDFLVAIAADLDRSTARDLANAYTAAVHQEWPQLRLTWGISREHTDVLHLPSALNESRTALAAAKRLGGEHVFLYEELGIVRLLLGSGDDPDLQTFIEDVTGPLLAYDRDNDGSLIRTLRAFFDADCSQRIAAERLFVHHKTLRYRLERIRQLTGLDLSRHEDRMRADFALRLLQINQAAESEDQT